MMKKFFLVFVLFLSPIVFVSCDSSSDSEEKVSYNYMTFTADGVQKTYSSIEGWGFLTYEDDTNLYWNNWNEDWDDDDCDYVSIDIPDTVNTTSNFSNAGGTAFYFSLTIDGEEYYTDPMYSFAVTIIEWGSIGKIVKGTFEGTLTNSAGDKQILIENGEFEATNNTDQTEK